MIERNRGGRPRHNPDSVKARPLAFRTSPELRKGIQDAAARSGRSLTQEMEIRLSASLGLPQSPRAMLPMPFAEFAIRYERMRVALQQIQAFGHGDGHGCGFTCATIAAEALASGIETRRAETAQTGSVRSMRARPDAQPKDSDHD